MFALHHKSGKSQVLSFYIPALGFNYEVVVRRKELLGFWSDGLRLALAPPDFTTRTQGNMQPQQDQGAYVWPKMQDEQQWNTWCRGVEAIFKRWTCLRLAVEGGWGHDTDQNERELFNQVLTVFQRGTLSHPLCHILILASLSLVLWIRSAGICRRARRCFRGFRLREIQHRCGG